MSRCPTGELISHPPTNGIAIMSGRFAKNARRPSIISSRSPATNWKRITLEHVQKACALFDAGSAAPARHVQSLVLFVDGRRYPAKFIQMLAYRLACSGPPDAPQARCRDGHTIKFFERFGLQTQRGPSELISPNGSRRDSA